MSTKIMFGAFLVAILAGSLAVAAVAVWVLSLLLPVLVVAGVIGFGMLKYRQWQARRGSGVIRRT